MQPLSGNQRPDRLTSLLIDMSLVPCLRRKTHLFRSSSNLPRLPTLVKLLQNPRFAHFLTRCTIPCACRTKRHLNVQKWSEHRCALIKTSQLPKWSETVSFNTSDFEMCFGPEPRAFFRHRNFQKWSEHGVFCAF